MNILQRIEEVGLQKTGEEITHLWFAVEVHQVVVDQCLATLHARKEQLILEKPSIEKAKGLQGLVDFMRELISHQEQIYEERRVVEELLINFNRHLHRNYNASQDNMHRLNREKIHGAAVYFAVMNFEGRRSISKVYSDG